MIKTRAASSIRHPMWLVLAAMGTTLFCLPTDVLADVPPFQSKKPRYIKVVLTEDGAKTLSVVFDESRGTAAGYDVLYADVNFNGRFEETEKLAASVRRVSSTTCYEFPPIEVAVLYNEKAEGISSPSQVSFTHYRYSYTPAKKAPRAAPDAKGLVARPAETVTREHFLGRATIRLREGSNHWECLFRSFGSLLSPSDNLENAPVWRFHQTPELHVETMPDQEKEGHLGIRLILLAGRNSLACTREGQPVKARVEIRKPGGKVVHRDAAPLDRFFFG